MGKNMKDNPYTIALTPERVPNFRPCYPCGSDDLSPCANEQPITMVDNEFTPYDWRELGFTDGTSFFVTVNGVNHYLRAVTDENSQRAFIVNDTYSGTFTIPACTTFMLDNFTCGDLPIYLRTSYTFVNGVCPEFVWTNNATFLIFHNGIEYTGNINQAGAVMTSPDPNITITFPTCTHGFVVPV